MGYIIIDLTNQTSPSYDKTAGASGEAYTKGVTFILPSEYSDWNAFIDIKNAAGDKYRQQLLAIHNNRISYDFTSTDLSTKGRLFLDLVLIKNYTVSQSTEQHIVKPFRGEFAVKEAVCATNEPTGTITPILTEELRTTIIELLEITEDTKFSMFNDMDETSAGDFKYKNKTYINTDSLNTALSNKIMASVTNEKLVLTTSGGGS